ncbi:hypothetical protein C8Q73DRAFT_795962 [Cubamyces lactineus]|nr:hypothetical protein C8Q73DRAFT_796138 [Cubamyces lactineus]KAH9885288.1 hypothetical protein C8Q73DRAFT_795962 [Cubamyces lactineus]
MSAQRPRLTAYFPVLPCTRPLWVSAPVASSAVTSSAVVPLPVELYMEIAELLSVVQLRSFSRCCKLFHDISARILYRNIVVDQTNVARLGTLLQRLHPRNVKHVRVPASLCVQMLTYTSTSYEDDLRYIPVLCRVLAVTENIRYLELNLPRPSAKLLIAFMRRHGLSRATVSAARAAYQCADRSEPCSRLSMPNLAAVRANCPSVVTELARFRPLRAVVLNGQLSRKETIEVVDQLEAGNTLTGLEALTLGVLPRDAEGLLCAVTTLSSRLKYLGLALGATQVRGERGVATALENIVSVLGANSSALPNLETLSVDSELFLHTHSVVHADIKPDNIILRSADVIDVRRMTADGTFIIKVGEPSSSLYHYVAT